MAGCWRQVDAAEVVDEIWLAPAGGAMVGLSRAIEQDTLVSYEVMVIRRGASGLVLEAAPSGQPPAAFMAPAGSDTALGFENLTHDYPQVIRYARRGRDSLVATVSGTVRDRQRTINYAYGRVPCPGP
jgi:hypothetical protein